MRYLDAGRDLMKAARTISELEPRRGRKWRQVSVRLTAPKLIIPAGFSESTIINCAYKKSQIVISGQRPPDKAVVANKFQTASANIQLEVEICVTAQSRTL
jgi:hypothetical protein